MGSLGGLNCFFGDGTHDDFGIDLIAGQLSELFAIAHGLVAQVAKCRVSRCESSVVVCM